MRKRKNKKPDCYCSHYKQLITEKACIARQGRITSSRYGRFVDYYCYDQCKGSALEHATATQIEDHKKRIRIANEIYNR